MICVDLCVQVIQSSKCPSHRKDFLDLTGQRAFPCELLRQHADPPGRAAWPAERSHRQDANAPTTCWALLNLDICTSTFLFVSVFSSAKSGLEDVTRTSSRDPSFLRGSRLLCCVSMRTVEVSPSVSQARTRANHFTYCFAAFCPNAIPQVCAIPDRHHQAGPSKAEQGPLWVRVRPMRPARIQFCHHARPSHPPLRHFGTRTFP